MVGQAARCDAFGFLGLKDEPNGVEMVAKFRSGTEATFLDFDKRIISLCKGNVDDLTDWANRMRGVRAQFDELDRQLAVKGTRLFNWETVAIAMGHINAHRVATELLLGFNE
jgi:hypothetical protein